MDVIVVHVLLQRLKVLLRVVTHPQLAFQELQDLGFGFSKQCGYHHVQRCDPADPVL
jgi:hypothetical protein